MLPGVAPAEDVRSLKVMKRGLDIAAEGRGTSDVRFAKAGCSECADHWWRLTSELCGADRRPHQ